MMVGLLATAQIASAHVVVKPNQAGIGAFQTFTMSVPSEKDSATVALRLMMPEGLQYVTPTVKPGWKIEVKKEGEGEAAHVTEIIWRNGSIPAHMRDDFSFSAKVPSATTTLAWKARQTYANGQEVNWNNDPKAEQPKNAEGQPDFSAIGPYSQTTIVDDLTATSSSPLKSPLLPLVISALALLISLISLSMGRRKR